MSPHWVSLGQAPLPDSCNPALAGMMAGTATRRTTMRRWIVIILLLIYPFQVALAMADRCCLTTPQGVTHHVTAESATAAQPAYAVDDDHGGASDLHCAACVFVHAMSMPASTSIAPAGHATLPVHVEGIAAWPSHPAARPERPKW
jgi:hypothetical protein